MTYILKNPLMRNARTDYKTSLELLRLFLRGAPTWNAAKLLTIDRPTVHRFFSRARPMLFEDDEYKEYALICVAMARQDGMTLLLNDALNADAGRLFACAFHCPVDMRPKRIELLARGLSSAEQTALGVRLAAKRQKCRGCDLNVRKAVEATHVVGDIPPLADIMEKASAFMARPDAMTCWISVLCGLANFRGISHKNIRQYLFHMAISRAITLCDFPVSKMKLPLHVAAPVPPYCMPTKPAEPHQNCLELLLITRAVQVLRKNLL